MCYFSTNEMNLMLNAGCEELPRMISNLKIIRFQYLLIYLLASFAEISLQLASVSDQVTKNNVDYARHTLLFCMIQYLTLVHYRLSTINLF